MLMVLYGVTSRNRSFHGGYTGGRRHARVEFTVLTLTQDIILMTFFKQYFDTLK